MNGINFKNNPDGTFGLDFINGNVTLPGDYGGYVIASGCGSGKTTVIKQIILSKFPEGVVYAAGTIKECNEMYDSLVNECKSRNIELRDGYGVYHKLTPDKIISIHSEPRLILDTVNSRTVCTNGVNSDLWNETPEKLSDYYVIICTHYKLLHENPRLFFNYNSVSGNMSLNILRSCVSGYNSTQSSLPRQWILIDELPTTDPLSMRFEVNDMKLIGSCCNNYEIYGFDQGVPKYRLVESYKVESNFDILKLKLINASKGSNRINFGDLNNPVKYMRFELIASIIQENYYDLLRSNNSDINVIYNLSELVINGCMNTRILLFDGTGDLTFINSDRFKVLTYDKKYNSPIHVYKFDNHLDRSVKGLSNDKTDEVYDRMNSNIAELQKIIDTNEKTLIVTWKNLKSIQPEVNHKLRFIKNKYNPQSKKITNHSVNEDFNLVGYYNDMLLSSEGHEFSIIHYQSGLDKATNDYRDYDTIVFLGKFQVPNSAVFDFNSLYGCSTDLCHYTIYQLVQAVCRTRIRKHNGEPINVYFSSDWSDSIIDKFLSYMRTNKIGEVKSISPLSKRVKPKWMESVVKLGNFDEGFMNAVEKDLSYSLDISLDDLFNIVPVSRKEVDKYKSLVNYLDRHLNIKLNIFSSKTRVP